jgi:hypothetical protein
MRGTTKKKITQNFDIKQIYGHGSQRGSMPGMIVPAEASAFELTGPEFRTAL